MSIFSRCLGLFRLNITKVNSGPRTTSTRATIFNPCKPPEAEKKGGGYQSFNNTNNKILNIPILNIRCELAARNFDFKLGMFILFNVTSDSGESYFTNKEAPQKEGLQLHQLLAKSISTKKKEHKHRPKLMSQRLQYQSTDNQ